MTAEEFVHRLRQIAPPLEQYLAYGMSKGLAEEFRSTYLLPRRNSQQLLAHDLGEVGKLVTEFDLSSFNFCQVTFLAKLRIDAGAIAFGEEEADPIVMDPATREIRLQELGKNGFILARCARTPESFLDAMFEVARFMARPRADRERRGECRKAIGAAAAAAGGDIYYDFYDMILAGFLDPA